MYVLKQGDIPTRAKEHKMSKTPDFMEYFKGLMDGSMVDTKSASAMFASANEYTAKFNKIALVAAEKSAELSNAWVKDPLQKLEAFSKPMSEPTEAAKLTSEIAAAQMQATPEHLAKFAEVAKSAQMATIELLMAAGKDVQSEVTAAAKKTVAKAS